VKFSDGQVILIPSETPHYQPEWRHQLARVWVAKPELDLPTSLVVDDPWLSRQICHLSSLSGPTPPVSVQLYPSAERRANEIYLRQGGDNLCYRLQAMLLTEAAYADVAQDLALDPDTVEFYERVFFNCRGPGFQRRGGEQLLHFAMQGATRLLGYGYTGLVKLWRMPRPSAKVKDTREIMSECFDAGVGQLMAKYVGGQVQLVDISALFGQYISYERMCRENEKGHNEAAEALVTLLKILAPKLSEHANVRALGASLAEQELVQSAALADGQITGTAIADNGPVDPQALLDARIKNHLAPLRPKEESKPRTA
jgi:hypothetical protein